MARSLASHGHAGGPIVTQYTQDHGPPQAEIVAQHLTVRRGSSLVLEDVSLTAKSGEFITICGSSGSGKSTLLLALAGFVPAEGTLQVRGRVGVVWQSHNVFHWMTVRRQMLFALHDHCPGELREHRLESLLARTGLAKLANRYPGELSGGEIQRLGLARALAADPDILLMDEPFSSLDWQRRRALQEWLIDLWSETRKLILFVTHDVEEAIKLGDRVVLVRSGQSLMEVPVPFPRPRARDLVFSSEFNNVKASVIGLLETSVPSMV